MSPAHFELLLAGRPRSSRRAGALRCRTSSRGADPAYRLSVRFLAPERVARRCSSATCSSARRSAELGAFTPASRCSTRPEFQADPARHGTASGTFIVLNLAKRIILIGGTRYAGEMKKSIFTVLNYLLPEQNVFPMHCSANIGPDGDAAVFFGLSGTGKTTLSADPTRTPHRRRRARLERPRRVQLRGRLLRQGDPAAAREASPRSTPRRRCSAPCSRTWCSTPSTGARRSTPTRSPRTPGPATRSTTSPITSRAASAAIRSTSIFLTADAFGVLPPIARLTAEQAMYHFLSGYTAKVAGTERGVTEPQRHLLRLLRRAVPAPASRACTPRCWARRSRSTAPRCGWSTPAGPAAPTAPARG